MFSASLVASVTPMRPEGAVDLEAWARPLEFPSGERHQRIVIGGTTGESADGCARREAARTDATRLRAAAAGVSQ